MAHLRTELEHSLHYRLGEVAEIEVAPSDHRIMYRSNGFNRTSIGILKQSTANALEIARAVRAAARRSM